MEPNFFTLDRQEVDGLNNYLVGRGDVVRADGEIKYLRYTSTGSDPTKIYLTTKGVNIIVSGSDSSIEPLLTITGNQENALEEELRLSKKFKSIKEYK